MKQLKSVFSSASLSKFADWAIFGTVVSPIFGIINQTFGTELSKLSSSVLFFCLFIWICKQFKKICRFDYFIKLFELISVFMFLAIIYYRVV